jgi:hypothetical protein
MMEDRVYAVGDRINFNYYKERKQGVTANYPVKITGLLDNGFLEIEFDSRRGQVDKVNEDDILKKTTRVCTMNLGENFYKEDDITLKNKLKPHVFLSSVLYAVEEVLDYRRRENKVQFLLNRIPAMAVYIRPLFGVIFLQGHISLKNWTYCPVLRDSTSPFKGTCLLITLKQEKNALYGLTVLWHVPFPTL